MRSLCARRRVRARVCVCVQLTINEDGSALALIRGGMTWHASNYSDNTTWHAVGTNATGTPGPEGPQWPTSVE